MNLHARPASGASARVRGAAIGILITMIMGTLWAWWGDLALGGLVGLLLVVATIAIAAPIFVAAIRLLLMTRRMPVDTSINPMRTLSYRLAVLFEVIAIPVASVLLGRDHQAVFIAPVTAMIVGIHFFGLVPALRARMYLGIGLAMCTLAGLAMLLLPATETIGSQVLAHHVVIWTVVVGLGCAAILWASALDRLLYAYEWVQQSPAVRESRSR
jgi:hypothetical protein